MAIYRQPHIEEAFGRKPYVVIAGSDVENKADDGHDDHRDRNHGERMQIAPQQRVIDQQARDIRLYQADGC